MVNTIEHIVLWAKDGNVKVDLLSRMKVDSGGYIRGGEYFGRVPGTYILIVEGTGDRTLITGEPTRGYRYTHFRVPTSLRRDVVKRALKKAGHWFE